MLSQGRAEAAQKGDEYEGAQASHASDLVFNHAALPLRSYESANENGDEEWIDISKVHMAPLFYCPVNSFAWLMLAFNGMSVSCIPSPAGFQGSQIINQVLDSC